MFALGNARSGLRLRWKGISFQYKYLLEIVGQHSRGG
jgi:hypothetical protein